MTLVGFLLTTCEIWNLYRKFYVYFVVWKGEMMQKIMVLFSMFSMLILTACGNLAALDPSEVNLPEEPAQKDVPTMEITPQERLYPVTGHERARDFVVAHVAELAGLPLPEGEWVFQDQS
jgi:hypothetical protein